MWVGAEDWWELGVFSESEVRMKSGDSGDLSLCSAAFAMLCSAVSACWLFRFGLRVLGVFCFEPISQTFQVSNFSVAMSYGLLSETCVWDCDVSQHALMCACMCTCMWVCLKSDLFFCLYMCVHMGVHVYTSVFVCACACEHLSSWLHNKRLQRWRKERTYGEKQTKATKINAKFIDVLSILP